MVDILIICLIGAIAGGIAGRIVNTEYNSLLVDIVIGIVGGYLGFRIFHEYLPVTTNIWINKTITSIVGAVILCLIVKVIRRLFNW